MHSGEALKSALNEEMSRNRGEYSREDLLPSGTHVLPLYIHSGKRLGVGGWGNRQILAGIRELSLPSFAT